MTLPPIQVTSNTWLALASPGFWVNVIFYSTGLVLNFVTHAVTVFGLWNLYISSTQIWILQLVTTLTVQLGLTASSFLLMYYGIVPWALAALAAYLWVAKRYILR